MATRILDYTHKERWSFRRLPWRRIILGAIAAYIILYLVLRGMGVITYRWGGDARVTYAHDIWEYKAESLETIFVPMIAVEMAARDLGRHIEP